MASNSDLILKTSPILQFQRNLELLSNSLSSANYLDLMLLFGLATFRVQEDQKPNVS